MMRGIAPARVFVLAVSLIAASAESASPFQELIPSVRGTFDPDRIVRFSVGELHFDVPNRFLAFPFQGDDKPFDRDVCNDPMKASLARNTFLCHSTRQAFFFKLPIPVLVSKGEATETSVGTLGWGQRYSFKHQSIDDFANSSPTGMSMPRLPELDTNDFVALANGAPNQVFFFRKDNSDNYRRLTCIRSRKTGKIFFDMDCTARIPYLADRFKQDTQGYYPYSIEFGFTGTEIDNVTIIGAAVVKKLDSFLER